MSRSYRPYTPSRRFIRTADFSELADKPPEKRLTVGIRRTGGRNNTGRIMVRHIGGRHRRRYRLVDFKRDKWNVPARVVALEYDPNRSARLALLQYMDGERRYILHPAGLRVGESVVSGEKVEIKVGNALPLKDIPEGSFIHNLELQAGCGGKLVRSAGAQAQLMSREGEYAHVKMPSGEVRLFPKDSMATLGQVGNVEHNTLVFGNAGRRRHMGVRPTVRGTAMNAVDHPHGGGRGKSKGHNHPRSPHNQLAKGYKTRRPRKVWDWVILQDRRRGKGALVSTLG
ncbi:MAG: 50S ribosomal protein L2 [Elusimicrobia bacterium]|nr:50S ribosomal protein L2 [Elusimicrobiota bacterium]